MESGIVNHKHKPRTYPSPESPSRNPQAKPTKKTKLARKT